MLSGIINVKITLKQQVMDILLSWGDMTMDKLTCEQCGKVMKSIKGNFEGVYSISFAKLRQYSDSGQSVDDVEDLIFCKKCFKVKRKLLRV
jgi:hypothetical protein